MEKTSNIHIITHLMVIMMILMASVLASCHGKDHEADIKHEKWAEIFFEERLSSISSDSDNKYFYIGTEDGGVYFGSKESIVKYNTPFNRIYCVKRDVKKANHYWVGTRNMGLFYCRMKGDSLVKVKSYIIPEKNERYSVYDICFGDNDLLYLGTSNGFFCTPSAVDTMSAENIRLKELWYKVKPGDPVLVSKVRNDRDNIYFTAPNAIYRYSNGHSEVLDNIINKTNVKVQPSLYKAADGHVMAIMGNSFYDSVDGSPSPLGHTCFDFVFANQNLYLVSKDYLYIISNGTPLPGLLLPSQARQECRNVIINDSHDQVLLVTTHHLIRIPHHIMPPTYAGSDVRVSASCIDKNSNTAYYFVSDTLYQLKSGETAHEKCILDSTKHHPGFLVARNNKFYYTDNNRLFTINDKGGYEKEYPLPQEATAMGSHGGSIYIGVRDSLLRLKGTTLTGISLKYGKNSSIRHPFITAFCTRYKDDNLYIATLNDGVFRGKDGDFQRDTLLSNDLTHRFIRDIAILGDSIRDTVLVLTHRGLWVHPNGGEGKFISSPGYNRLLVYGSQVAAVTDFGLRKFTFNLNHTDPDSIITYSDYYQDWRFIPELSLSRAEGLLICRSNKVLAFNSLSPDQNDPRGIEFEPKPRLGYDWFLVLLCTGLAAVVLLMMYLITHRNQQTVKMRNKELSELLKEVESLGLTNFDYIRKRVECAMSSYEIGTIEHEIEYLNNVIKAVKTSTNFKKEYNSRKGKMREMMSDQSFREQSILAMVDRLMEMKIDAHDDQDLAKSISEFETFDHSSLDVADVKKSLASIAADVQKALPGKSDFTLAVTEILKAQIVTRDRIIHEIENNPTTGWDAVDTLFEAYSLKIRNEMCNGFIRLNALISCELREDLETLHEKTGIIRSIKEKARKYDYKLKQENKQFDKQQFINESKLLTEEERTLIESCDHEILQKILNTINSIYSPWFKESAVDKELLSQGGFLKTQSMEFVTLDICCFEQSIWDALIDAFSLKYLLNNSMQPSAKTIISRFTGKGSKTLPEIKKYAINHPESIASLFCQKKE